MATFPSRLQARTHRRVAPLPAHINPAPRGPRPARVRHVRPAQPAPDRVLKRWLVHRRSTQTLPSDREAQPAREPDQTERLKEEPAVAGSTRSPRPARPRFFFRSAVMDPGFSRTASCRTQSARQRSQRHQHHLRHLLTGGKPTSSISVIAVVWGQRRPLKTSAASRLARRSRSARLRAATRPITRVGSTGWQATGWHALSRPIVVPVRAWVRARGRCRHALPIRRLWRSEPGPVIGVRECSWP